MKIAATLLLIFAFEIALAQNDKPQREAFTLKLPVDGVSYYEQEVKSTPYFVRKEILQIYPSEKIFIEAEVRNDSIVAMKTVQQNLNPSSTIEIEFIQKAKDGKNESMLLKVKNPFDKQLVYKAHMFIVGNDKWIPTSIIPIMPKIIGYETWTDVIITLALDNWRLIK